jgi:hypothetical protein
VENGYHSVGLPLSAATEKLSHLFPKQNSSLATKTNTQEEALLLLLSIDKAEKKCCSASKLPINTVV